MSRPEEGGIAVLSQRPENTGSRLEKRLKKATLHVGLCGELSLKGLALGTAKLTMVPA